MKKLLVVGTNGPEVINPISADKLTGSGGPAKKKVTLKQELSVAFKNQKEGIHKHCIHKAEVCLKEYGEVCVHAWGEGEAAVITYNKVDCDENAWQVCMDATEAIVLAKAVIRWAKKHGSAKQRRGL